MPRQVIETSPEKGLEDQNARWMPEAQDLGEHADIPHGTWGFIEGMGKRAWIYADRHPHTVVYGLLGLLAAVLILTLGLWRTIVIAVFALVGAAIGQVRDGRGGMYEFFNRLFSGRR
ncbi:DUF2273 domain-containing protein [Collinsella sp. AGMB00827]|uniref:DUF2273 domain-containing protein n=2 Tax=Collinsella ureilytica TaxID=2869515 RepID=A0ABS7MLF8_9ACTN|nr:DUF2273 domain-containing protein [Collinsella urealyticum]MBY4798204.1 DUF2273 domain-containing protein [Collinsella urealyticum]